MEKVKDPETIKEISIPFWQNRFLLRKSNDTTDPTVYQWWVPLTYTSDYTQTKQRDWLSVDEFSKSLPNIGAAANQWVIFNVDQQS
jgi:aminopeptidase N